MWLALDTSGRTSTVALTDGDRVIAEVLVRRSRMHSEQLIMHMDTVCALVDHPSIDGVAVSAGPGSFTGLRIGLATAKSLAYAWHVPLVAVNSLATLMYNYRDATTPLCAIMDAQKGNVYYSRGYWSDGILRLTVDSRIAPFTDLAQQIASDCQDTLLIGDAVDLFTDNIEKLPHLLAAPPYQRYVRAGCVGQLAAVEYKARGADNLMTLAPLYLRRSEAEILWEKKQCQ